METIVVGEVNEKGRAGLIAWLAGVLADGRDPEVNADHMLAGLDGSFAADCGLQVEVRRTAARSGNPEIYSFDAGEYDLVTYDEDGREVFRRAA